MERLTAQDMIKLWPDDVGWPQDIGALAILDGARLLDADDRFRLDAVRAVIEDRLHFVPRLRQVLGVPRRGLGLPVWVDAPAFDLGDHVRVAPVPPLVTKGSFSSSRNNCVGAPSSVLGRCGRCGSFPG